MMSLLECKVNVRRVVMSDLKANLQTQKNKLYRDNYRKALLGLWLMVAIALFLSIMIAINVVSRRAPKFYATTSTGDVIPMQSLGEPVVSNKFLLQWAGQVARNAYNVSFVDYQSKLAQLKPFFTSDGWQKFSSAMNAGVLNTVKNQKLEVSAIVDKSPVVLSTEEIHGYLNWLVQVHLLVTYTSASQTTQQHVLVNMQVQRVSTLSTPKGILVNSFVVQ